MYGRVQSLSIDTYPRGSPRGPSTVVGPGLWSRHRLQCRNNSGTVCRVYSKKLVRVSREGKRREATADVGSEPTGRGRRLVTPERMTLSLIATVLEMGQKHGKRNGGKRDWSKERVISKVIFTMRLVGGQQRGLFRWIVKKHGTTIQNRPLH